LNFNNDGDKILTGAFDGTAIVTFSIMKDLGHKNRRANPFVTRAYC